MYIDNGSWSKSYKTILNIPIRSCYFNFIVYPTMSILKTIKSRKNEKQTEGVSLVHDTPSVFIFKIYEAVYFFPLSASSGIEYLESVTPKSSSPQCTS